MSLLPRNLDSIFDDFFPSVQSQSEQHFGQIVPRVDIEEQDNKFLVKADLPGIKKEDLHVDLHNGLLTIRASHSEETEDKEDGKVIRRERHSGSYTRSFNVGDGVTENDISGDFTDGVLTLTVPKKPDADPAPRRIEIS